MSDSETESSSSDQFQDAVETVDNTEEKEKAEEKKVEVEEIPKESENESKDVALEGTLASPDIEDQIHILTGGQVENRDMKWGRLERLRRKGESSSDLGLGVGGAGGVGCEGSPLTTTSPTPPGSAESSVEGIFIQGVRSLHPFKVVESDGRSLQSDSRLSAVSMSRSCSSQPPEHLKPVGDNGSVAAGSVESGLSGLLPQPVPDIIQSSKPTVPTPSISSQPRNSVDEEEPEREEAPEAPHEPIPELSAVVSASAPSPSLNSKPVAPPRRKRTGLVSAQGSQDSGSSSPVVGSINRPQELSPESTLSPMLAPMPPPSAGIVSPVSLDRVSINLNMASATRGEYVVRPQDDEGSRGSSVQPEHTSQGNKVNSQVSQDPGGGEAVPEPGGKAQARATVKGGSNSLKGRANSRQEAGFLSGGSGSSRSMLGGVPGGGGRGSGESRKSNTGSGGSDGFIKQMNTFIRTKSDSGKKLTDQELLQQIKVKNLDTGMEMDLATAEEQLPQSINPLSLHIMRLTSEYTGTVPCSRDSDSRSLDSDTGSFDTTLSDFEIGSGKKKPTFGRLITSVTKSAKSAAKALTSEVTRRQRTREEREEEKLGRLATDISTTDGVQLDRKNLGQGAWNTGFKRIQAHKSGPHDFEDIQFGQDLSGHHEGPIWCMKFSLCGKLLATGGQDGLLRIWVLRDKHNHFNQMRIKFQEENEGSISEEQAALNEMTAAYLASPDSQGHIFMNKPFVTFSGHTSELLDISWSKNYFILTSSMDKTVRLWHISRVECLCVFQHIDFVTAIAFNPRNDQFFISGSLDGKIRLWNIPDKKVALWNEVDGSTKLITAANYCQAGKFAVVGTYDGRCIFFSTDQLKYHTTIHVRSNRGKNARGRKVTGIEPMPGSDKILVTSTDSRIRLYDLRDLSLVCKYKGYTNLSSQIRAAFSPDGRFICAGSENQCVFLWSSLLNTSNSLTLTNRKDRNNYYEAIRAHTAAVTCSLFAPEPKLIFQAVERGKEAAGKPTSSDSGSQTSGLDGYVVVSGDFDGEIKIFINQK